jgi:hypothetical protein
MKRTIHPKVLKRFRLATIRRKLWKDNYERMKGIARSGNKQSTENHRQKSLAMKQWVLENLPRTFSPEHLKQVIDGLHYKFSDGRDKKTDSFIRRLKDRNLIRFDWQSGCYVNLVKEHNL